MQGLPAVAKVLLGRIRNLTLKKLTDDQLLDKVQRQTFRYFWDFAEPHSGMARERYHPDGNYPDRDANIVTTGGSGFGLMSIISATNRGYIKRKRSCRTSK